MMDCVHRVWCRIAMAVGVALTLTAIVGDVAALVHFSVQLNQYVIRGEAIVSEIEKGNSIFAADSPWFLDLESQWAALSKDQRENDYCSVPVVQSDPLALADTSISSLVPYWLAAAATALAVLFLGMGVYRWWKVRQTSLFNPWERIVRSYFEFNRILIVQLFCTAPLLWAVYSFMMRFQAVDGFRCQERFYDCGGVGAECGIEDFKLYISMDASFFDWIQGEFILFFCVLVLAGETAWNFIVMSQYMLSGHILYIMMMASRPFIVVSVTFLPLLLSLVQLTRNGFEDDPFDTVEGVIFLILLATTSLCVCGGVCAKVYAWCGMDHHNQVYFDPELGFEMDSAWKRSRVYSKSAAQRTMRQGPLEPMPPASDMLGYSSSSNYAKPRVRAPTAASSLGLPPVLATASENNYEIAPVARARPVGIPLRNVELVEQRM